MAGMTVEPRVVLVGPGAYRVDQDGRFTTVYVAGPADDRWVFWEGQVFRVGRPAPATSPRSGGRPVPRLVTAPMPGTVVKVLVQPGSVVAKGEPVVVLEAMKMELPLQALEDGIVVAVRCREGELVQPDAVLVELESRS